MVGLEDRNGDCCCAPPFTALRALGSSVDFLDHRPLYGVHAHGLTMLSGNGLHRFAVGTTPPLELTNQTNSAAFAQPVNLFIFF